MSGLLQLLEQCFIYCIVVLENTHQSCCLNCTKFGKLILRKIIKIVATRCYILKLKCTKFHFDWDSAPDPAGELTALPQTLGAYF